MSLPHNHPAHHNHTAILPPHPPLPQSWAEYLMTPFRYLWEHPAQALVGVLAISAGLRLAPETQPICNWIKDGLSPNQALDNYTSMQSWHKHAYDFHCQRLAQDAWYQERWRDAQHPDCKWLDANTHPTASVKHYKHWSRQKQSEKEKYKFCLKGAEARESHVLRSTSNAVKEIQRQITQYERYREDLKMPLHLRTNPDVIRARDAAIESYTKQIEALKQEIVALKDPDRFKEKSWFKI